MKILICTLALLVGFISCSEEEANTPTKPIEDDFDPMDDEPAGQGTFVGVGGHTVTGMAKIFVQDGTKTLVLDPFMSQNGPDLKVYLSKDEKASEYVNLGPLKSVTGKQSYIIPATTNLSDFTYVHIWCEAFSVEFARAML